jgi:FkbM family methyltransferase
MPLYVKSLVRLAAKRLIGCDIVPARSETWLGLNLTELLRELQVTCVVDVGAHHGEFGLLLRGNGYTGRIVSFEPVSRSFTELGKRRAADRRWDAYQVALGERDGTADMNVTRHTPYSSLLEPLAATPPGRSANLENLMKVDSVETVQMRRLDSIFATWIGDPRSSRVFLKLDTQGYDSLVLRGAAACLDRVVGVQTEVAVIPSYAGMTSYKQAIAGLERLGFELSGLFPVTHDSRMRAVELDCLMVRTSDGDESPIGDAMTARVTS